MQGHYGRWAILVHLPCDFFLMKVHEEGEGVSNMMRMRWITTQGI